MPILEYKCKRKHCGAEAFMIVSKNRIIPPVLCPVCGDDKMYLESFDREEATTCNLLARIAYLEKQMACVQKDLDSHYRTLQDPEDMPEHDEYDN